MRLNGLVQLIFVGGVIGAFIWIALARHRRQMRRLERVLRGLARRTGGEVSTKHWLLGPASLLFPVRDLPARIEFTSSGGKHPVHYTDLTVSLKGKPRFPVKLGPEGVFTKLGKVFGMQDIELGDARFDSAFSVQSSDEERLRAFLTPQARRSLLELMDLDFQGGLNGEQLWLEVAYSEMRVRKIGWVDEWQLAQPYLELCTQIIEGYLDAVVPPEAQGGHEAEPAGESLCPVCRDGLPEQVATCQWCGARHHPECFELNDGCGKCGAKAPRAAG